MLLLKLGIGRFRSFVILVVFIDVISGGVLMSSLGLFGMMMIGGSSGGFSLLREYSRVPTSEVVSKIGSL